jgi:hypothetical protein
VEGHEYPDLQVGDEVNPRTLFVSLKPINRNPKAEFPMENHIKPKARGDYPPPSDGLFLPTLLSEMAAISRIRAFFRLLSFR